MFEGGCDEQLPYAEPGSQSRVKDLRLPKHKGHHVRLQRDQLYKASDREEVVCEFFDRGRVSSRESERM